MPRAPKNTKKTEDKIQTDLVTKPISKTPKVPKAPKTPKTPKAPKVPKAPAEPKVKKPVAPKKAAKQVAPQAAPQITADAAMTATQPVADAVVNLAPQAPSGNKLLEVCLLLDCTGSMSSWIERSKQCFTGIMQNIKSQFGSMKIKFAFVGYRDINDTMPKRFDVYDFSEDVEAVTRFIATMRAGGNGNTDLSEDVQGGLNQALHLKWTADSIKQAFLICDNPGHGRDISDTQDSYPNGSPDGFKIQDQMKEFSARQIDFTVIKVNNQIEKMIRVMKENYDVAGGRTLTVSDISNAVSTKSFAEVTQTFAANASFIISTAVKKSLGGAGSTAPKSDPLWETSQFAVGQYLSQNAYYTVTAIAGNTISIQNQFGDEMQVSKDILEKMDSASHFEKEVPLTMTQLAELMETCGDTVFTVQFRKQPNEDNVKTRLETTTIDQLKDEAFLSKLTKELIEGEQCTMVCHMVEADGALGRSTVIDLSAKTANKFRQVDHRSISFLILRNVKYVLSKGSKKQKKEESDDEMEGEKKKDALPKWKVSEFAVGNTFSGTSYFQAKAQNGDQITTKCEGKEIIVSKDIIECQMQNASVFAKEEKISMTKVAQMLESAHTACFTVCFTAKVDDKVVKEKITATSYVDIQDKAKAKQLASEILQGKETVIVGRLSKSMGKLGRSLVIDLPSKGYRQVDHRTLKWLILKNVKYVVK